MKIISEPRKNIALIWRSLTPSETVYRPMRFLLQAQVDDGLLLYNVVTAEMILLDEEEQKVFERLPAPHSTAIDELIAHHFVVSEDFDESKSVRQLRALLKKLEPSKRVHGFTILPTTECNARCYYCFESDHKRCTLTEKLTEDVINYITRMCKGEPVEIEWFGGEPLVGRQRITQICEGLEKKGIKYRSTMVSNAYLFDEDVIHTAKEKWKLRRVQITLDGTEQVYNETKAYVNPRDNPYIRVLQNIENLLKNEIAVTIRLNVTDKNFEDLSKLIDELEVRYKDKKGFYCYSHAVYEGVGFEPLTYDDQAIVDSQTVALDAKLRDKGLLGSLSQLPSLRVIHCMADSESSRLIYPDGTIGKCENMPSTECVGDIYQDITNTEKNAWYQTTEQSPDCEKCFLYPDCFDLKPCPEAGQCSPQKRDWKINRYTMLMKERYQRQEQKEPEPAEEELDFQKNEC